MSGRQVDHSAKKRPAGWRPVTLLSSRNHNVNQRPVWGFKLWSFPHPSLSGTGKTAFPGCGRRPRAEARAESTTRETERNARPGVRLAGPTDAERSEAPNPTKGTRAGG